MSTPSNILTGGSTISSSEFEIPVLLLPDGLNAIKESTTLAQMISQPAQNEMCCCSYQKQTKMLLNH